MRDEVIKYWLGDPTVFILIVPWVEVATCGCSPPQADARVLGIDKDGDDCRKPPVPWLIQDCAWCTVILRIWINSWMRMKTDRLRGF